MRSLNLQMLTALFLGSTMWAQAVIMVPLEIEEMADSADLILEGKVVSLSCLRDQAGRIFTRVEVDVAETWKGRIEGKRLEVFHGGGVLGESRVRVAGQVHFQIGEEVVLFLVRNDRGEAVTLGLAQGKFQIISDSTLGARRVQNPFHGNVEGIAAARHSQSDRIQRSAVPPGKLTLAELKERVDQRIK